MNIVVFSRRKKCILEFSTPNNATQVAQGVDGRGGVDIQGVLPSLGKDFEAYEDRLPGRKRTQIKSFYYN